MDNLKAVNTALEDVELQRTKKGEDREDNNGLQLLASGGYNDVWLVSRPIQDAQRYILRKPKEDALLPDQIRNEVAFLTFVRDNVLDVPVPKVYGHSLDDDAPGTHFIAQEYIDGELLSSVWKTYDEATKMKVARQVAEIVVKLGETTLDGIGGLMLDHKLGPTVEGMKLFKGRVSALKILAKYGLILKVKDKFHSSEFYDLGPYKSTKAYVLACYDKEIYYYSHAAEEDIDPDFFKKISIEDYVRTLQKKRQSITEDDTAFTPEEPFVLIHGDFHGRNIMIKDGRIAAVLDWEFAGFYPLSELLAGVGVDVLEMESEEDVKETYKWSDEIVRLAGEMASSRGWDERSLELLLGTGNPDLQEARVEMVPWLGGTPSESSEPEDTATPEDGVVY